MGFTVEEKLKFKSLEKFEAFRLSENFKSFRRIREARLLLYTLRSNYRGLLMSIGKFHKYVETLDFWSPVSPYLRPNTQKKISKDLFNYLSAACAIIDLSRRYARKMLSKPQQIFYGNHIKEIFVTSISYRIIRNLRNYVSHYANLNIGVSFEKHNSGATKSAFYLSTKELLDWDEWDDEERNYLNNLGDKFEIENLLKAYHLDFIKTEDKFFIEAVKNQYDTLISVPLEMKHLLK